MKVTVHLIAAAILLAACDATVADREPVETKENNVLVLLPQRTSGAPLTVDTVSHFLPTLPQTPLRDSFRITVPPGTCRRFSIYFREVGWAGGKNCSDGPYSRVYPVKVKGELDPVTPLRACCPHNAGCNLNQDNPGVRADGGADFLIGLMPNGHLATTVRELGSICPLRELEGAENYPDTVFTIFHYPIP